MKFAGITISSRTIERLVGDEAGEILLSRQADTGFEPMREAVNWNAIEP